jgi:hypothetical protein
MKKCFFCSEVDGRGGFVLEGSFFFEELVSLDVPDVLVHDFLFDFHHLFWVHDLNNE